MPVKKHPPFTETVSKVKNVFLNNPTVNEKPYRLVGNLYNSKKHRHLYYNR